MPGTTRLFLDYLYDFPKVSGFYRHAPYDSEALRHAATSFNFPADRRTAISDALEIQNPGSPLVTTLRLEGTVVVATGQQVGYLGGPAYTIFKALTAVRVAQTLNASGIRAVPVFWLASEDHDLAEVDHAWLFDARRQPVRYQAEKTADSDAPVGSRPAPAVNREALAATLSHLPFCDSVTALAADAYCGSCTYTEAFRRLLERILGEHKMLFLDPLQPAIRKLAAPLLSQAVERSQELSDSVAVRSQELQDAGYHAQVHWESDTSFFFLLAEGRRVNLKSKNGGFANGRRSFAISEIASRGEDISPNALLRPVLQDFLMPTACLVGGPAEIAYLSQSAPLYDALLGRQPVFLPRNGFTLIDESASRSIDRYRLAFPQFFTHEAAFLERLAHTRIPGDLLAKMESTVARASHLLDEMRRDLLSFDPTLADASERSHKRVLYQFQKLERKTAREIARREERVREDAAYLRGLIFPEKHPQERLYSFLPFLAVHGTGLVDVIYKSIHENCPDHHVLVV